MSEDIKLKPGETIQITSVESAETAAQQIARMAATLYAFAKPRSPENAVDLAKRVLAEAGGSHHYELAQIAARVLADARHFDMQEMSPEAAVSVARLIVDAAK